MIAFTIEIAPQHLAMMHRELERRRAATADEMTQRATEAEATIVHGYLAQLSARVFAAQQARRRR